MGAVSPTVDGSAADDSAARWVAATRAAQYGRDRLRDLHSRTERPDDEDAFVGEVVRLTDEVLELEQRADRLGQGAGSERSGAVVVTAAALLVAGGVVLVLGGLLRGWVSGWGFVVAAVVGLAGVAIAVVHRTTDVVGHRRRAWTAAAALGAAALAVVTAQQQLPWWVPALALAVLVGSCIAAVSTASTDEEHRHHG